jgi:hypothetical protein
MKKLSSIIVILVMSAGIYAQTDFEKAMKSALTEFDSSKTLDDMKAVAAKFERISAVETNQWLPSYYAAFINCLLAFKTQDAAQIKLYTDNAQKFLDEALKRAPEESENHALQGMIYQAIIGIDPMNNGMVYSGKAATSFETAEKLNPANPRPYYLQALSVMYTPEQFGGGKKAASGLFEKAGALFAAFVPSSEIAPNWGKDDCFHQLSVCKEN